MISKISESVYGDVLSMKNEHIEVVVSNLGCAIMKVLMKDKNGNISDVVLGYHTPEEYMRCNVYFGCLVGRVANRIAKGTFTLNDKEYKLAINNGPNALHGGVEGFNRKQFDYEIIDNQTIQFHYTSKHMEEGYPGTLDLYVTYELVGSTLFVNYKATTSEDTLINITNHSYFNLNGKADSIYNHKLQIHADAYAPVDSDGLVSGEIQSVQHTPFDFNEFAYIKDRIELEDEQLKLGNGFDHPFIFSRESNQVILEDEETGRRLTISSTLPQAQVYSANYVIDVQGKNETPYTVRSGICFETQNMPDAIHVEETPSTILKKKDIYEETTSYSFEVIK